MSKTLREIRIFLASPEDAILDRKKAITIIKELERSVANSRNLHLRELTWEDVSPDMGRAEEVILDQIKMNEIDIFIGIMWKRFGSPTGRVFESGTEEEFQVAYNEWKIKESPRIMFYFKKSGPLPTNKKEINQYQKVINFKNNMAEKGLYKEYSKSEDFSKLFHQDLTNVIINWKKEETPEIVPQISLPKKAEFDYYEIWRDAFADKRQPGESVESWLYKSTKNIVKFMTISGRSIFRGDVEEALKSRSNDFHLKMLLYDWNIPSFLLKMRDERRITRPEIEMARRKAAEVARSFIEIGLINKLDIEIKLYNKYPIWRMIVIDNETVYVGYYPKDKRGYEGPMFIFRKDEQGSLFYPMNQYFDKIWEISGCSLTRNDKRFKLLPIEEISQQ